jgi:hypothetical protein
VDPRYDLILSDPGAVSSDGSLLFDSQGIVTANGLRWDSATQMATRITEAIDYTSFDQWSVVEQSDWHHGRGLEVWDNADPERFYDSYNVDTRIRNQLTLAPGLHYGWGAADGYAYPGAAGTGIVAAAVYASVIVTKLAQSFQVAVPVSITAVTVRIAKTGSLTAGSTMTLRVETNNAGLPSGNLVHANATSTVSMSSTVPGGTYVDYTFSFTSFAISAATTYHIVLSHNSAGQILWQGTTTSGYASGAASAYLPSTSAWTTLITPADLFFELPDITNLIGTVSCFAQFGGRMYVGAGKGIYEWDNTNKYWVASKTDFANNVSDMAVFAGVLWVAHSEGNVWTFNRDSATTTWTEKSDVTASFLSVYKGYLYRTTYGADNAVIYTADGTTWSSSYWKVGNSGRLERMRRPAGYNYDIYVPTTHGLYQIGPESEQGDLVDQVKSWASQSSTSNGYGARSWAKDGKLYIPLKGSLLSYSEGLLDSIGPDQDAGLPSGRQGDILETISLTNWLVAIVSAGANGTSSVLAYNGIGWHELARCPGSGYTCQAIGYDTTVSPNRLWFGYGWRTAYVELPDQTDNPYLYSTSVYRSDGYVITPWVNFGLLGTEKDFGQFGMQYSLPTGGTISVEYEVDRSGLWTPLFTLTGAAAVGNVYTYDFPFSTVLAPATDIPVTAAGCTANVLKLNTAVYLETYDWLRINGEVRQMLSYDSDTQITLARPLSSAPAAGVYCYPSRACGAEIRFRINLSTTNTAVTPLLKAWWLKAMPMLSDKLAGRFTCDIYDGQVDKAGNIITPDAATRVAQLYSFANRPTPIDLIDARGTSRRVKITAITETQNGPVEGTIGHESQVRSTMQLSVIEV